MIERISASVTFVSASRSPSRRVTPAVLLESSQTNGEAAAASSRIGRAMILAMRSAAFMPIRLGTSSPKMSVR